MATIWKIIEEAPKYRVSNFGRIENITWNRLVRIRYLEGGRAYVILNRTEQTAKQLFVDELVAKYFGK